MKLKNIIIIILSIVILATVTGIIFIVSGSPAENDYTEFYLMDAEGMAEDYPAALASGETANLTLGIINHENAVMEYEAWLYMDDISLSRFYPISLEPEQTWQENINFTATGATTTANLTAAVKPQDNRLLLDSVEKLQAGDYIKIGEETVRVQALECNTALLAEPLLMPHAAGDGVTGMRKLDIYLHKVRHLDEDTSLSLWLGRETAGLSVINEGEAAAEYKFAVVLAGSDGIIGTESTKDMELRAGEEREWDLSYAPVAEWPKSMDFTLYRDGSPVYQEKLEGEYPHLRLWFSVY
jgi:hypothetical protein